MHPTWAGDLFHPRQYTCFTAVLSKHRTLTFSHRVQKSVLYICVFLVLGNDDDGQCLILNKFLMCVFCQKERHKQKIKIITTLISLVLMYFHLEDTQVHEIPISEHCAKKWSLTRVFESLWSFCRESSQCPPGCTVLSFWPRGGEKEGDSELEASAAETQTRSVNAGVWIPAQRQVENKGSLFFESL